MPDDDLAHRRAVGLGRRLNRDRVGAPGEKCLAQVRVLEQVEDVGGRAPQLRARRRAHLPGDGVGGGAAVVGAQARIGCRERAVERGADRVVDDEPMRRRADERQRAQPRERVLRRDVGEHRLHQRRGHGADQARRLEHPPRRRVGDVLEEQLGEVIDQRAGRGRDARRRDRPPAPTSAAAMDSAERVAGGDALERHRDRRLDPVAARYASATSRDSGPSSRVARFPDQPGATSQAGRGGARPASRTRTFSPSAGTSTCRNHVSMQPERLVPIDDQEHAATGRADGARGVGGIGHPGREPAGEPRGRRLDLAGIDGDDGDVRRLVAQPLGERVKELGLANPGQAVQVERQRPLAGGEPDELGELALAPHEGLARALMQPIRQPCHACKIARYRIYAALGRRINPGAAGGGSLAAFA